MKTAYVTGASGFLGINLVHQLVEQGYRIIVLHRPTSDLSAIKHLPIEFAVGDVCDFNSIMASLPENTDVVFHVAASTSFWISQKDEQTRINVEGTRNLAKAALLKKVKKFILTSSISAFGLQKSYINESTPTTALSSNLNYMLTKWQAEEEVRAAVRQGLDAVILNPSVIMGPHDHHNWGRMIRMVAEKKLPGIPPGTGSFSHVREIARAHITAAERGRTGENYILGGQHATYAELIRLIAKEMNKPAPTRVLNVRLLWLVGAIKEMKAFITKKEPDVTRHIALKFSCDMLCDSSKAMRDLNYVIPPLEETVKDACRWVIGSQKNLSQ